MAKLSKAAYAVKTPTGEYFSHIYRNALDFYLKCDERPVEMIRIYNFQIKTIRHKE
jgi:hypothetical protein